MKVHWGVDVQIYIFLTSALAGDEWSASRPCRFTPKERTLGTHWIWGCVDLSAGLNDVKKRKFLTLPGLQRRPLGRYTNYDIPAPHWISNLQKLKNHTWNKKTFATIVLKTMECVLHDETPYHRNGVNLYYRNRMWTPAVFALISLLNPTAHSAEMLSLIRDPGLHARSQPECKTWILGV
jgi:hypothetical protein